MLNTADSDERSTHAILIITYNKVYANDDQERAFREGDALGGHDPYSASKAAREYDPAAVTEVFRTTGSRIRWGRLILRHEWAFRLDSWPCGANTPK